MSEILSAAVSGAVRAAYGPSAVVVAWEGTRERRWSWQTTIHLTGTPHSVMVVKVPRWEEVPTLADAVAAGQQESTVAEFEALQTIGAAVAASRDPGLTAVDAVAYMPTINGILMSRIEGRSLRVALRGTSGPRTTEVLARVGRLLKVIHESRPGVRQTVDMDAVDDAVGRLAARAEAGGVGRLVRMMRDLERRVSGTAGHQEPMGFVHGDLNASNLLVDRSGRVAVIDPNPSDAGPQLNDVARIISELRDDRWSLLTGGLLGGVVRRRRVAVVLESAGAAHEPMLPLREALDIGERWMGLEEATTGLARVALIPARIALSRRLRSVVAASS